MASKNFKIVSFNNSKTNIIGYVRNEGISIYDCKNLNVTTKVNYENCKDTNIVGMFENSIFSTIKLGRTLILYGNENKIQIKKIVENRKILNTKVRNDLISVSTERTLNVYTLPELEPVYNIDDIHSTTGMFTMTQNPQLEKQVILYPTARKGQINIYNMNKRSSKEFKTLEEEIGFISLDSKSELVAIADVTGRTIKIMKVCDKSLVAEFTRGSEACTIKSMEFSPSSKYLCVTSNKETVHLFAVENQSLNQTGWIQYGQWSFAKYYTKSATPCIAGFSQEHENLLYIVCEDGTFCEFLFAENGKISVKRSAQLLNGTAPMLTV